MGFADRFEEVDTVAVRQVVAADDTVGIPVESFQPLTSTRGRLDGNSVVLPLKGRGHPFGEIRVVHVEDAQGVGHIRTYRGGSTKLSSGLSPEIGRSSGDAGRCYSVSGTSTSSGAGIQK